MQLKVLGKVLFSGVCRHVRCPQAQMSELLVMERFPLGSVHKERFSHSTNLGAFTFYSCVLINNYIPHISYRNISSCFGHFSLCCFYKGRCYTILCVLGSVFMELESLPFSFQIGWTQMSESQGSQLETMNLVVTVSSSVNYCPLSVTLGSFCWKGWA